MVKPQYALSYNRIRNDANWVSWNLHASDYGRVPRYRGKFIPDEALPPDFYRVHHDDYTGSGYDRGHMVRSEERTASEVENRATFWMTNILPQQHDLNAGPWLRLEEYCQQLAQRDRRELYLTAGGVFERQPSRTIGHGVAVPDRFYKIVVVLWQGEGLSDVKETTRVIAVSMPNVTGILENGWGMYRTTVDDIESRTGYDFLPMVPESVQRVIEARKDDGPTE